MNLHQRVTKVSGGSSSNSGSGLEDIRERLEGGQALSSGWKVPKKPRRAFVESRRLLADWYYQNKQWRKQAAALKVATESRGPYRRDPMVLLSLASPTVT